ISLCFTAWEIYTSYFSKMQKKQPSCSTSLLLLVGNLAAILFPWQAFLTMPPRAISAALFAWVNQLLFASKSANQGPPRGPWSAKWYALLRLAQLPTRLFWRSAATACCVPLCAPRKGLPQLASTWLLAASW